jgi:uncharacterized protein DUF3800
MAKDTPPVHHYFVDEAGDLAFFDRRGRVIVGQEGVSGAFIVGAALIHEPESLATKLEELRQTILTDPYFSGVPSVSAEAAKTALLFHAKDDLPEVRRQVFDVLRDLNGVEIYAAFRRKGVVARELAGHYARTGYKLGAEFIYDELVTEIFKNRLHLAARNHIVFARRGKADRNIAITNAIALAKAKFEMRWKKGIDRPTTISSSTPSETVGLQVADYYLWALQRFVERREDRFFNYLRDAFRLVLDRDDMRREGYGEYYTASKNPLTLEKMMPVS